MKRRSFLASLASLFAGRALAGPLHQALLMGSASRWSFVSAGTQATDANPSVGVAAGYASGNLLIIFGIAGNSTGYTTPAGWTAVLSNGGSRQMCVFWKIAGSSESAVSITGGNAAGSAVMLCYSGVTASDAISTLVSTASTQNVTSGTLTTTAVDDLVLTFVSTTAAGAGTWTSDGSVTSRVSWPGVANNFYEMYVGDESKATAGVTTGRTTNYNSTGTMDCYAVAFKH